MHFTMDGREYELTSEIVRARLASHQPEPLRQYSVEIDGVHRPINQVLRLATGSTEFQSQTARRHLQRLGFTVHGTATPRAADLGASSATNRAPVELAVIDRVDLNIVFEWHLAGRIRLDASGKPTFPGMPDLPGLYRFEFGLSHDGIRTYYVGESDSLRRRASNYRNATSDNTSQRTSRRVHKEIVASLAAGRDIDVAIATEARIGDATAVDLRRKSARRLAENAGVLLAQLHSDVRVLNIDTDLANGKPGQK